MINRFLAKYVDNGITKTVVFNKSKHTQQDAEKWLKENDIKNFFFLFEPVAPKAYDENTMLYSGEVGFDITADNIMDSINEGKDIIIDSTGGSHFEGLKIHDMIRLSGKNPSIGVIGVCASAAFDILLASDNRWVSENSRGLIHNPWRFAEGDDEAFFNYAKALQKEKNEIAKMYSNITDTPTDDILALMKEERFMTPEEMLQYNFITEIRKSKSSTNQKNVEMTEKEKELTEKVGKMEGIINGLKNLFSPKETKEVKNLSLQDANGVEINFPNIEEESQITVGETAEIDGAPATGSFVVGAGMHEGKTLVFENGELVEIIDPETEEEPSEEMEALQAENAALKEQLEVANKFKATAEKEIKYLESQVKDFKNLVTTGDESEQSDPPAQKNETKKGFTYKKK